ncbi:hypothetical protein [Hymenobacter properus]|uniref:Uncharacterized protein n=1 Tax=Hymenobacter properus TaxID=2791026 RepID=A0A931FLD5_9BACT|nr:hypothetical protein [Hymenobacter properus]MBF9140594.1 hypothetical protein [Hymenobacter properus]MBR7719402.1 hypothetical protein [Microvirga sp. SRT04]
MQPTASAIESGPLSSADRQKFRMAALNSTAIYVLAYYLVWGVHQVAKFALSKRLHLRGNWEPSRINYIMADGEWTQHRIIAVYGIGPLLCLVFGFVAFLWYWKRERARPGIFKLLLLWIAFHACNAILGALLADSLRQEGFWYVPDWIMRLGSIANTAVALLAGAIQLIVGRLATVPFLQAHDSHTLMQFRNRRRMVFSTIMAPWLLGGLFIAVFKLPYFSMYEFLHLLIMGLLLFSLILGCISDPFDLTVQGAQPTHVAWGFVVLAVITALVWRLELSPPHHFG